MGESLYGKFGSDVVIIGFILLIVAFFSSINLGWLMPTPVNIFYMGGFIIEIIGIVLGIIGIKRDDLREKAIRSVIAGIFFLIAGIGSIIFSNLLFHHLSR